MNSKTPFPETTHIIKICLGLIWDLREKISYAFVELLSMSFENSTDFFPDKNICYLKQEYLLLKRQVIGEGNTVPSEGQLKNLSDLIIWRYENSLY